MTSPTARVLVADATRRLAAADVETPRVDAELLLAGVLGTTRSAALLRETIPGSAAATYEAYVTRRAAREPLQHILGEAPFRHVVLEVGPGVFVPRPETELLVDAVLPVLREVRAPLVVDLCAGSGALAVSIADEVPDARVVAVERSAGALRWLVRNAPPIVQVLGADITDPELLRDLRGRASAVVCNPPYVPADTPVSAEVRADPAEAVFAGADGLDLVPKVILRAGQLLGPHGILAMEHDETHAAAVLAMLHADPVWTDVAGHRDLSDRPRFVTARRTARTVTAD